MTTASSGAMPAATASRTMPLTWPRVGDVLRVAIVRAEGDAPGAVLLDEG